MQQNPYAAPAAGYAPPQGGAQTGSTDNYEFNATENETIGKLAKRARTWGVFSAIGGVLGTLGCLLGVASIGFGMSQIRDDEVAALLGIMSIGVLVVGARFVGLLVIGLRYIKAGKNLDLVVSTEGNDIALAVEATESMGKAFWLDFLINIAFIVLAVVGVIVAIAGVAMLA